MQHEHYVLGMLRYRIPGCKDICFGYGQATCIEHFFGIIEQPDTGPGGIGVWMLVKHASTPIEDAVQDARSTAHLPGLYA